MSYYSEVRRFPEMVAQTLKKLSLSSERIGQVLKKQRLPTNKEMSALRMQPNLYYLIYCSHESIQFASLPLMLSYIPLSAERGHNSSEKLQNILRYLLAKRGIVSTSENP